MTAEARNLLDELRLSYSIRADGAELCIKPPLADPALRDRVIAHKPDLLALLQGSTDQQRETEIDRPVTADGWIPNASTAQALAHELVKLSREYTLNLHAAQDGILLSLPHAMNWLEVLAAIEYASYEHAI